MQNGGFVCPVVRRLLRTFQCRCIAGSWEDFFRAARLSLSTWPSSNCKRLRRQERSSCRPVSNLACWRSSQQGSARHAAGEWHGSGNHGDFSGHLSLASPHVALPSWNGPTNEADTASMIRSGASILHLFSWQSWFGRSVRGTPCVSHSIAKVRFQRTVERKCGLGTVKTTANDDREPERRSRDEQIAPEPPLQPLNLPAGTVPQPVEAHSAASGKRPLAVAGIVETVWSALGILRIHPPLTPDS